MPLDRLNWTFWESRHGRLSCVSNFSPSLVAFFFVWLNWLVLVCLNWLVACEVCDFIFFFFWLLKTTLAESSFYVCCDLFDAYAEFGWFCFLIFILQRACICLKWIICICYSLNITISCVYFSNTLLFLFT